MTVSTEQLLHHIEVLHQVCKEVLCSDAAQALSQQQFQLKHTSTGEMLFNEITRELSNRAEIDKEILHQFRMLLRSALIAPKAQPIELAGIDNFVLEVH